MHWLGAIKNFVLGAPQVAEDVFDKKEGLLVKAGGFINDLSYTEAEKARDMAALAKEVTEHIKSTLSESTARSLTRRSISILWIKAQLGLILMVAICIPLNVKWANSFFELATCNVMMWGTGSVIIFFFGAYAWGAHIKKGDMKKLLPT